MQWLVVSAVSQVHAWRSVYLLYRSVYLDNGNVVECLLYRSVPGVLCNEHVVGRIRFRSVYLDSGHVVGRMLLECAWTVDM